MKALRTPVALLTFSLLGLFPVMAASSDDTDQVNSSKRGPKDIDTILASVRLPELPATAADLILHAAPAERETVALAAVRFAATSRPGSIAPVVSSVTAAIPEAAPAIAATAVKLVPTESSGISQAAVSAAPELKNEINRALGKGKPDHPVGPPVVAPDRGNRPSVPRGLADGTKQGSIRGNRPAIPPGHVRDPMPGRDPQRRRYGSP